MRNCSQRSKKKLVAKNGKDAWVLGFDCHHSGDFKPGMDDWQDFFISAQTYKTMVYVENELKEQTAELRQIATGTATATPGRNDEEE